MITAELTRKIDLLPQESYNRVENFVEQLRERDGQAGREIAFRTFMDKMSAAETSVQEEGCFSEEEVEEELQKI